MVGRLVLDGSNALTAVNVSDSGGRRQVSAPSLPAQGLTMQQAGPERRLRASQLQEAPYLFEFDPKLFREPRHRLRRAA